MSEGRLIAIGDIHGCSSALRRLLKAIELQPSDTIVTLGDYIDRGPDTRGVIDVLLDLSQRCRLEPLLGNHEQMLLEVVVGHASPHNWIPYGAPATLDSYGFSGDLSCIPQRHLEFLQSCRPYFETDDFFFTHANYDFQLPLDQQPPELLRWKTLRESTPKAHISGKIAIVGHTAHPQGQIVDLGFLRCLDTFCYGGLWLTAMDVRADRVWQADDQGELRIE